MLSRRLITPSLAIMALAAFATIQARAQVQAGGMGAAAINPDLSPEDQAQVQQMQQMGQQIQQNIQNSGIDINELRQQMADQYQNGTLDPEAMQQMLIDKGIITQDMMNQMQGSVRKLSLSAVRRQMNSTDEEWAIIEAKIGRVLNAQADVSLNKQGAAGGGNATSRMLAPPSQNSQAAKAYRDLKAILREPNASENMIAAKLQAWRDAYAKAQVELVAAQDDLVKVITLRQEAVLLILGVI